MAQVTPIAQRAFSTVGLPEPRRIELWESHNADALIGLKCRTLTATVLEATEINVRLPQLDLARVRGNAHVVERDHALIEERPTGSVALFFSLMGEAFFYDQDGVHTVRPGQMLLCDADRPFMRGFSQGLEELVVKVPREVFAEVADLADLARLDRPKVVNFAAGANLYARALADQVGGATRSVEPCPADESALLDLVAALVGKARGAPSEALHAAAKTYIEQHLSETGLSAAQVAAAVGISTRHLSRVFATAGTSVPKFILTRRLRAARKLLTQPTSTPVAIAEAARRCGFVSAAHFSHAFSSHFGERATDVRRRTVAFRAVPPG